MRPAPSPKPDYVAFRHEVRTFIEANLTDAMRQAGRLQTSAFPDMPQARAWQSVRAERGWGAPAWPIEYGGTGWDLTQRQIFQEESLRAGTPGEHLQSLNMCGPCLIGHGTAEQKAYYLPRILSAEHVWCQGYSEPGSGSDLASLKTSAEVDGDDYILNGTKIWTSNAHEATHMFALVRTSTQGKPQQGITFVLLDMTTEGITVEPIINLNGKHEQNTVFLDNVRIPQTQRVGPENGGWTVAKYLLEFERAGVTVSPNVRWNLGQTKQALEADHARYGHSLLDDEDYQLAMAQNEIDLLALEFTENRIQAQMKQGQNPGVLASFVNVIAMDRLQDVDETTVESVGLYAAPYQPTALETGNNAGVIGPESALTSVPRYFDNRAATIAGGSSEVQRNIIAKAVLGL